MKEETIVELLKFGVKFGLDATISVLQGLSRAATIDDAIAALEVAKTKTAQQYLDEAPPTPPVQ